VPTTSFETAHALEHAGGHRTVRQDWPAAIRAPPLVAEIDRIMSALAPGREY
jgi:hypothetical protein